MDWTSTLSWLAEAADGSLSYISAVGGLVEAPLIFLVGKIFKLLSIKP